MESETVSIDEVRALVAERQRYEGWLTALEQRRSETPAHVYTRVQQDYATRRAAIVTALRGHAGPLAAAADALEGKVDTLTTELATVRDERAEAMLRTAVGEFDPAQWDALRDTLESRIGALESDRAALEAERDELRALLTEAGGAVAAAMGQGSGVAVDTVVAVPEAVEPVDSEPVLVEPVTAAAVNAVLEEDFGVAVVEAEAVDVVEELDADIVEPEVVEPEVAEPEVAEPEVVEPAIVEPAIVEPAVVEPAVVEPAVVEPEVVEPEVESAATDSADADLFDELAFLRAGLPPAAVPAPHVAVASAESPDDVPSDPRKTLRCAECRSWNLPTEWYCERCGGELNTF